MKRYLKLFKNKEEYDEYRKKYYPTPFASITLVGDGDPEDEIKGWRVDYDEKVAGIDKYLTFSILSAGTIDITGIVGSIYYQVNDGSWTEISSDTNISAAVGDEISLKANGDCLTAGTLHIGCTDAKFNAFGNIMSLVGGDNFSALTSFSSTAMTFTGLFSDCDGLIMDGEMELILPAEELTVGCYENMFLNCDGIIVAPDILATTLNTSCYSQMFMGCENLKYAPLLPATTLANDCYDSMFRGCYSLVSSPELPATALTQKCYYGMFRECSGLTSAPALPATTLASQCYQYMFADCDNLTTSPALPATTLASNCYANMFDGCNSLTISPALPSTTLADNCYDSMFENCSSLAQAPQLNAKALTSYCYRNMFYGCTSLETAPELPATSLATYCYDGMFYGCTGLTEVPALPAALLADYCYRNMFHGCTSIEIAPTLNTFILTDHCYENMFYDCSSLRYIKCYATSTSATDCTKDWVNGVSGLGTFVKNERMDDWTVDSVNGIPVGWTVESESPSMAYLTFNILSAGTINWMYSGTNIERTIEYSINGGNWVEITSTTGGTSFNVSEGDMVSFRGNNSKYSNSDYVFSSFNGSTAWFTVEGNPLSLIDSTGFTVMETISTQHALANLFNGCTGLTSAEDLELIATGLSNYCYQKMFYGCINLTTAPELPATILANQCYRRMFEGCTSLTDTPALPATTLAQYCYQYMFNLCSGLTGTTTLAATSVPKYAYSYMFNECQSLTTAPALPATTLGISCYESMFHWCKSLTTAPVLPATTLEERCYQNMFYGCTSLTTAPSLPATNLSGASNCYNGMFIVCTSLTTAPELPATILANGCYEKMFDSCTSLTTAPSILPATTLSLACYREMFTDCTSLRKAPILPAPILARNSYEEMFINCTSLNFIECLATSISAFSGNTAPTELWVNNVSGSGIFVKADSMTNWLVNDDGIPYGWTLVNKSVATPLTLNITSNGTIIWSATDDSVAKVISYSKNGSNWTEISASGAGTTISVTNGDTIQFKGDNETYSDGYDYCTFGNSTASFTLAGNILSLVDSERYMVKEDLDDDYTFFYLFAYSPVTSAANLLLLATGLTDGCYNSMFAYCDSLVTPPSLPASVMAESCYAYMFYDCSLLETPPTLTAMTLADSCYMEMFDGCSSLTFAPQLPATALSDSCYYLMFNDCESIEEAPTLPATSLTYYCYFCMFAGCTELEDAPALPATVLAEGCYYGMFDGCTSLTTAPALTATTMVKDCYRGMFNLCSGLEVAPELPATTLAQGCYAEMFNGCTSITSAPVLNVSALTIGCYEKMFNGCSNLNYIECYALDITASASTYQWVNNVASAGTFVRDYDMLDWEENSINGIPSGWTIETNIIPYEQQYLTFNIISGGTIPWKKVGSVANKTIQYSVNDGEWTSLTCSSSAAITGLTAGDVVRIKGSETTYAVDKNNYAGFSGGTAIYEICGNIMSLTHGDSFSAATEIPAEYCFCSLFKQSKCVSAENLVLPATTLKNYCYRALFSLAPNLLVAPKELPATTLAIGCYWYMFEKCSFQTAPFLPAQTLDKECYGNMFNGCTNLNYIVCLATSTAGTNTTTNWVNSVAPSGTFVKDSTMSGWALNSANGIPVGWTVVDYGVLEEPEIECDGAYITITCPTYNASIYYRLGQTGTFSLYSEPIELVEDTMAEAYSVKGELTSTTVNYYCRTIKTYRYAGMELSNGPLCYSSNTFVIKNSWNYDSFNTTYGKNNGSTYFNFVQLGQLFESATFSTADGDIDKDLNPLDGWRLPTEAEFDAILGTVRSGSTVNGSANKHFAKLQLTGVTHANTNTPTGFLIFPDGEEISGVSLTNIDNGTANTGITEVQLNNYLEQGCVFLPCNGSFYSVWNSVSCNYWTSTEDSADTVNAYSYLFKSTDATMTHGIVSKTAGYFPVYLVRGIRDAAERDLRTWVLSGQTIETPYSVNAINGHSSNYKKGEFDFTTKVNLTDVQTTYLWFQHADQSAAVYVNNVFADKHWGGYTSFFVDITSVVKKGDNNIKVTLKNNEGNNLAPSSADFNFNATLGNVKLFTSPVLPAMSYGYDGFHVTSDVATSSATITVKTNIPTGATVVVKIDDDTHHYSAETASTGNELIFTDTIANPHLWNGILDPHLYDITLEIYHDNELYHRYVRPYGLRFYEYAISATTVPGHIGEAYTGFLLNGSPYLLRGVCMHDDIEGKANALNEDDYDNTFATITELNCNFLRLAHYPHPKEVYDRCDQLGIIVQTEVPLVNNIKSTQPTAYYTHLEGQITDMVTQHYNHPCIVFWGLGNEFNAQMDSDGGAFACTKLEHFRDIIKSYDTERMVGCVLNASSSNPRSTVGGADLDWYGCNIYVGWYSNQSSNNPTSQLNTRITSTITNNHKALAYSEYGCGGTQACHSDDFMTTTTRGNHERHDIEYMMWLHEGHIAAIKNKPELIFTSQWQLFDIAVSNRNEGYTVCLDGENITIDDELRYLNNKGLVERDHKTKKDTFYLYKAWWNQTDKFVHICGKDYIKGEDRVIKCYTNDGDTLSMYINNSFIATASVTNNIALFDAMEYNNGDNIVVCGATSNDHYTFVKKDYREDPLTFNIISGGEIYWKATSNSLRPSIEYNKNGGAWTSITSTTGGTSISVNSGDTLMFRANQYVYSTAYYSNSFSSSTGTKFNAKGNIMSLFNSENYPTLSAITNNYAAANLFNGCSGIISARKLVLPATTLTYRSYLNMFNGCTSLIEAPELPATTLANDCYYGMFAGCTSLTTAHELPATTLAQYCYEYMFAGCTSLTTAPVLPATTLNVYCYANMFAGCTSLTQAPVLPATVLASSCYRNMFSGCTNLSYINSSVIAPTTGNVYNWVFNVAESGIFVKSDEMTTEWELNSPHGIPCGWTVYTQTEYEEYINEKKPLTFNILSSGTVYWKTSNNAFAKVLEYSKDGVSWTNITATTAGTEISVDAGEKIMFRGDNTGYTVYNNDYVCGFSGTTAKFTLNGNIMSLVNKNGFESGTTLATQYTFYALFNHCDGLISANNVVLYANTMTTGCFASLFLGCHELVDMPKLKSMSLSDNCYDSMFAECTNLTRLQTLPARTLSNHCYQYMFRDCTGLTTTPELPATTLADYCYYGMFQGCTNITDSSDLSAKILTNHCYQSMFSGCSSLNYIECYATSISATDCTSNWVFGVSGSGTFIKDDNMLDWVVDSVDGIPSGWTVYTESEYIPSAPLTFKIIDGGTIYWKQDYSTSYAKTIQYSKDNGLTWTDITSTSQGEPISVNSGDKLLFRGNNASYGYSSYCTNRFQNSSGTRFNVKGNIMSLINSETYSDLKVFSSNYALTYLLSGCKGLVSARKLILPATTLMGYCYYAMFSGCTGLQSAPELPATTLANYCYCGMFGGCTSLTTAPELPSTTLASSCYYNMFGKCTSLTTAPELPVTTLANSCYGSMFKGCTSLTTAPELPATTLADSCYSNMFKGCTSLTTAPELPATTLTGYCYNNMFNGCTSLTQAPELPATTLANYCYDSMFQGCTSLTTAPELPATTLASYCYYWMFQGCTSLTTAPELPATTLAQYCYAYMFQGCTGLTTPMGVLPATTLVTYCYYCMFKDCVSLMKAPFILAEIVSDNSCNSMFRCCTNLINAPTLLPETLTTSSFAYMFSGCTSLNFIDSNAVSFGNSSTNQWTDNVSQSGVFVRNEDSEWEYGINGIPCGWTVYTQNEYYNLIPFTFDILTGGTIYWKNNGGSNTKTIQYSKNSGSTWITIESSINGAEISVNAGESIQFKGVNSNYSDSSTFNSFSSSTNTKFNAKGNIMSLVDATNYTTANTLSSTYTFSKLFYGCEGLVSGRHIILGATTLSNYCYYGMFENCKNLTSIPKLPSTTLSNNCYDNMFKGCTSITTSPELNAETLVEGCYSNMFNGCSNLSFIKCLATDISALNCTTNWVSGVSNTGTFMQANDMIMWEKNSVNGIPDGWNVIVENYSTPLTFKIVESGTLSWTYLLGYTHYNYTKIGTLPIYYNINETGWKKINATSTGTPIMNGNSTTLSVGDTIQFKANNAYYTDTYDIWTHEGQYQVNVSATSQNHFTGTAKFDAYGNIMSMVSSRGFETMNALPNGGRESWYTASTFTDFFNGTNIVSAENLLLPATAYSVNNSYRSMFKDCNSLTIAPTLPPTDVSFEYAYMFYNCPNLRFIKCLHYGSNSYPNWVYNVASAGTFIKQDDASWAINSVNGVPNGWTLFNESDYKRRETILTFNIVSGGTIIWKATDQSIAKTIQYRINMGSWSSITATIGGVEISVNSKDKIQFKGDNSYYGLYENNTEHFNSFSSTTGTKFSVNGNLFSFINSSEFYNIYSLNTDYCFFKLFNNCEGLISAEEMVLPALDLSDYCYYGMFSGCINLVTSPELPATNLSESCYEKLFYNCTNLTSCPKLSTKILEDNCYSEMFCGCVSITEAPYLPAPTLANGCYYKMFSGCSNLNYIECYATDISATNCTKYWVSNVSGSGTFAKEIQMTDWTIDSDDGVPVGWVVENTNYGQMLTFNILSSGTIYWTTTSNNTIITLEYSKDNGNTWYSVTPTTGGSSISVTAEEKVLFRGDHKSSYSGNYFKSDVNVKFSVEGNIMSLNDKNDYYSYNNYFGGNSYERLFENCVGIVSAKNLILSRSGILSDGCYRNMFKGCTSLIEAPELPATTLANYCYDSMFQGCTSLTTAPALPATTLASYCYYYMFAGCTSLTGAPELSATTLENCCYREMFYNCTSLTQAPELPATTLASYCYYYMFRGCTSLTTAPELPATTLANYCYQGMFYGCTGLTTAPALPASALTSDCYYSMFTNCTSLTTAPALPAITLANYCYRYMFQGCTSLTQAPVLPATTLADSCYYYMFQGCTSLSSIPELPASTLAQYCYQSMFQDCTGLTTVYGLSATTLATSCYQSMFQGCTSLTTAPEISATTLASAPYGCYKMFSGCTSLIEAPELPATTLANCCYGYMFYGCTGLTTPMETLPATTLASTCYYYMFRGCTSLTTAPALPATTLETYCYQSMFENCTSLTDAPALPATALAVSCYQSMFAGCTSLTTAPELPASVMANSSYRYMFSGCTSLNYIKCLATNISASYCTYNWVNGIAATGTFVKDPNMSSWTTGISAIPDGWTVEDAS